MAKTRDQKIRDKIVRAAQARYRQGVLAGRLTPHRKATPDPLSDIEFVTEIQDQALLKPRDSAHMAPTKLVLVPNQPTEDTRPDEALTPEEVVARRRQQAMASDDPFFHAALLERDAMQADREKRGFAPDQNDPYNPDVIRAMRARTHTEGGAKGAFEIQSDENFDASIKALRERTRGQAADTPTQAVAGPPSLAGTFRNPRPHTKEPTPIVRAIPDLPGQPSTARKGMLRNESAARFKDLEAAGERGEAGKDVSGVDEGDGQYFDLSKDMVPEEPTVAKEHVSRDEPGLASIAPAAPKRHVPLLDLNGKRKLPGDPGVLLPPKNGSVLPNAVRVPTPPQPATGEWTQAFNRRGGAVLKFPPTKTVKNSVPPAVPTPPMSPPTVPPVPGTPGGTPLPANAPLPATPAAASGGASSGETPGWNLGQSGGPPINVRVTTPAKVGGVPPMTLFALGLTLIIFNFILQADPVKLGNLLFTAPTSAKDLVDRTKIIPANAGLTLVGEIIFLFVLTELASLNGMFNLAVTGLITLFWVLWLVKNQSAIFGANSPLGSAWRTIAAGGHVTDTATSETLRTNPTTKG